MKELLERVTKVIVTNSSEPVILSSAIGRVIARDVYSVKSVPFCDTCNVDGYAVIASSITQLPMPLKKVGRSRPTKVFNEYLNPGEVVEILADMPLPPGADSVIPRRYIESDDGYSVVCNEFINEGLNVSSTGIDVSKGDIIFAKGTVLNSRHVVLATVLNIPWLPVTKFPRIGILTSSSDNVKTYDDRFKNISACIAEAVSYFIESNGAMPVFLGQGVELYDTPEEIILFKANLENALKSIDVLLVIGGVENSAENIIFTSLNQRGAELTKQRISIGSGHSVILGNYGNMPVIGLPSHCVAFILFARLTVIPIINKIIGMKTENKHYAKLTRDLDEFDKNTDYLYGILTRKQDGEIAVSPVSAQDSLMLSVLTRTECMIIVDLSLPLTTGTSVEIVMLSRFSNYN